MLAWSIYLIVNVNVNYSALQGQLQSWCYRHVVAALRRPNMHYSQYLRHAWEHYCIQQVGAGHRAPGLGHVCAVGNPGCHQYYDRLHHHRQQPPFPELCGLGATGYPGQGASALRPFSRLIIRDVEDPIAVIRCCQHCRPDQHGRAQRGAVTPRPTAKLLTYPQQLLHPLESVVSLIRGEKNHLVFFQRNHPQSLQHAVLLISTSYHLSSGTSETAHQILQTEL